MENLSCKIIDVDFKNKKKNFSFETKANKVELALAVKHLNGALAAIKEVSKDDLEYQKWCKSLFFNIISNLKRRI